MYIRTSNDEKMANKCIIYAYTTAFVVKRSEQELSYRKQIARQLRT